MASSTCGQPTFGSAKQGLLGTLLTVEVLPQFSVLALERLRDIQNLICRGGRGFSQNDCRQINSCLCRFGHVAG